MKIVVKDNFNRDLFTEYFIAENVSEYYGRHFVKLYNDKHWYEDSDTYLELVKDDYELYDGYKDLP